MEGGVGVSVAGPLPHLQALHAVVPADVTGAAMSLAAEAESVEAQDPPNTVGHQTHLVQGWGGGGRVEEHSSSTQSEDVEGSHWVCLLVSADTQVGRRRRPENEVCCWDGFCWGP